MNLYAILGFFLESVDDVTNISNATYLSTVSTAQAACYIQLGLHLHPFFISQISFKNINSTAWRRVPRNASDCIDTYFIIKRPAKVHDFSCGHAWPS